MQSLAKSVYLKNNPFGLSMSISEQLKNMKLLKEGGQLSIANNYMTRILFYLQEGVWDKEAFEETKQIFNYLQCADVRMPGWPL